VRQLPGERVAWVVTALRAQDHRQKHVCSAVFWNEQDFCKPPWALSVDADFSRNGATSGCSTGLIRLRS